MSPFLVEILHWDRALDPTLADSPLDSIDQHLYHGIPTLSHYIDTSRPASVIAK